MLEPPIPQVSRRLQALNGPAPSQRTGCYEGQPLHDIEAIACSHAQRTAHHLRRLDAMRGQLAIEVAPQLLDTVSRDAYVTRCKTT